MCRLGLRVRMIRNADKAVSSRMTAIRFFLKAIVCWMKVAVRPEILFFTRLIWKKARCSFGPRLVRETLIVESTMATHAIFLLRPAFLYQRLSLSLTPSWITCLCARRPFPNSCPRLFLQRLSGHVRRKVARGRALERERAKARFRDWPSSALAWWFST